MRPLPILLLLVLLLPLATNARPAPTGGFGNIGSLLKNMGGVGGSGGSGGQSCSFQAGELCAAGQRAVARPGYKAEANGCGSYGLSLKHPVFDFTDCCNVHDVCYGTCNRSQSQCDKAMKRCMRRWCKSRFDGAQGEQCRSTADMYFMGTVTFGCAAWKASQKEACLCEPHDEL